MTSPTRVRVLTPEALDSKAASLVSTTGSALRNAVQSAAGSSGAAATGVSAPTANTVMQRDGSGRSQVAAPSAGGDIVNKTTMDAQIATRIATTDKGVASGVATLDGSGFVTSGQLPSYMSRNLGTGTTLPTGRMGDTYYHSGVGCLFMHNGTAWRQAGQALVATRSARNALATNYSSVLHEGFIAVQDDKDYRWRWTGFNWMYAGFAGIDPFGQTTAALRTKCAFRSENFALPNGAYTRVNGWVPAGHTSSYVTPEWLTYDNSNGGFFVQDQCALSIHLNLVSDSASVGRTDATLFVPGGDYTHPNGGGIRDAQFRSGGSQISGGGTVAQSISWSGSSSAGVAAWVDAYQITNPAVSVSYSYYISFEILPG